MFKIFLATVGLAWACQASGAPKALEIKNYDMPLLYHLLSKDEKLSVRQIAEIAAAPDNRADPIWPIANQLSDAWSYNKEFQAHDAYETFMSMLRHRTANMKTVVELSMLKRVDWETSAIDSLKYDFTKGGFKSSFAFGDGALESVPSSAKCQGYNGKLICFSSLNPDPVKFFPMPESVARRIAELRDSRQLAIRQTFQFAKKIHKEGRSARRSETVVIPIMVTAIDLVQIDLSGDPVATIATLPIKK